MANGEPTKAIPESAALQFFPPSVVLSNSLEVVAYRVLEFPGVIAKSVMTVDITGVAGVQVIAPSVLLKTPAPVAA